MVTLRAVVSALESIAPLGLAESWDNVGLLAGDPGRSVSRVLLTIDLTGAVVDEMVSLGADVVVSYHPPIFQPLKRIPAEGALAEALRRGFAIYSPHTALDGAVGGTNDVLADAVGLEDRAPLRPMAPRETACKLVTFVPEEAVAAVSAALFAAGAGRIGAYSSCSFRSLGTGTFFGEAGAQPVVGAAGRLETVPEVRLETVVPLAAIPAVVEALRRAHPYEEPAFDLVRLAAPPARGDDALLGMGRIGSIAPTPLPALVARVKERLGLDGVLLAGPDRIVRRVAVAAGSAGDLVKDAARLGADVVVTGEVRHHDALAAAERGVTLLATLHSRSERPALAQLARRLGSLVPGLDCVQSARDVDPLRFA